MPLAGEEGYEQLVICPYDKAHEIRKGRMQFHLKKCRANYRNLEMTECPFNSSHVIPKVEEQYHIEHECRNKSNWDRFTHDVGDTHCPVKDLVPVNAGIMPEGEENWDDYENPVSVLNTIKSEATEKSIFRMLQCESKAKRKKFRREEQLRHQQLQGAPPPESRPSTSNNNGPLPRPRKSTVLPIEKQDPSAAIAQMNSQFRSLDLNPSTNVKVPSETSSIYDDCSLDFASAADTDNSYTTMNYASALASRTSTAMSSAMSKASSRPSTAMSIEKSVNRMFNDKSPEGEGFCQVPIPGLGRGRRTNKK